MLSTIKFVSCLAFGRFSTGSVRMLVIRMFLTMVSASPRIRKLFRLIHGVTTAPPKASIKKDAWLCKSFAVLLKRKHRMGMKSRIPEFRYLLKLLDGVELPEATRASRAKIDVSRAMFSCKGMC